MKKKKFSFDLQRFAGVNTVRDKLINFEVFKSGNRKLGMADVTLPDISYKTARPSPARVSAAKSKCRHRGRRRVWRRRSAGAPSTRT